MCFIENNNNNKTNNNGDMVTDQKEIMEGRKNLCRFVQSTGNIDVDLKTITSNAPRLTEADREITEGEITYTEAQVAVRAMKSNESPGSDGYTSEFYKYFFRDIGNFLICSIIYEFRNKQMSVKQRQGSITCIPKEGKPKHMWKNGDQFHYSVQPIKLPLLILRTDSRWCCQKIFMMIKKGL